MKTTIRNMEKFITKSQPNTKPMRTVYFYTKTNKQTTKKTEIKLFNNSINLFLFGCILIKN